MKHVFNSIYHVTHEFAQQNGNTHGRSSNLFFEGNKLYSYGYHYLLAEILADNIILINDEGYSVSTAKHIRIVIQATRQYTQIFKTKHELSLVLSELGRLERKLSKARKPEKYVSEAQYLISGHMEAQRLHPTQANPADVDKFRYFQELFSSNSDQLAEFRRKNDEMRKKNIAQYFEAFQNFEPFEALKNRCNLEYDLIRLSNCGEYVETSQNLRANKTEAELLYKALKNGRDIIGEKIDGYTITAVSENEIKIGCHRIKMAQINKIFEVKQ